MPVPRCRIRTLMMAVAVVAMPLSAVSICMTRAARFRQLSAEHESKTRIGATPIVFWNGGTPVCDQLTLLGAWHAEMAEKYLEASLRPWLPVPPDPPPPE